ncbi:MAG: HEPN domain-containing protein [Armatimonadota bacterium]|nr:HEPN domain-containing protein [Armatimonadota bacterium]
MKDDTRRLLEKASRAIGAGEALLRRGDVDFTASRAYYAMFYTAEALLHERGLRYRKHGGVHSAFGEHFVKTGVLKADFHRWMLDAFDKRIEGDYGVEARVTAEDAKTMFRQAWEFLRAARRHLRSGRR